MSINECETCKAMRASPGRTLVSLSDSNRLRHLEEHILRIEGALDPGIARFISDFDKRLSNIERHLEEREDRKT